MHATYYKPGTVIDFTAEADIVAGQVVDLGGFIGVAARPVPKGERGAAAVEGIYIMAKDSSDVKQGDALYWDDDGKPAGSDNETGALTKTAAGNVLAGHATEDAGTTADKAKIKLLGRPDLPHPEA